MQSGIRVFYIVEGDFKDAQFYESLLGALVNTCLRDGITVFRTWDLQETKHLIQELVKKCERDALPPTVDTLVTSKRKKDSLTENIWIRMLCCIPTISESIARGILTHFGSLRDLQAALGDLPSFPRVLITPKSSLGKGRIFKLAECLAPPSRD